jgi:CRISPR system Cascade subunit CasD
MNTLVLRLSGPLLAWPDSSRHRSRFTASEPTFSAIRGLLYAAAGIPRGKERASPLTPQQVAFRSDRPGSILEDFHTINPVQTDRYRWMIPPDRTQLQMVRKASGARHDDPIVTRRYYLQDSETIVFIGDELGVWGDAVRNPEWAFFAGRKSCPLSFPIVLGSVDFASLEHALEEFPATSPTQSLRGVLFQRPHRLVHVSTETRSDLPTGSGYRALERFFVTVSPPLVESWWDAIAAEERQ